MASKIKLSNNYSFQLPSNYRIESKNGEQVFDWEKALNEKLKGRKFFELLHYFQSSEQGTIIHNRIEDEFSDYDFFDFNGLVYQESGAERRYDCADGQNLYEFKTKSHHLFEGHRDPEENYNFPLGEDISQLETNLEETGYETGILVYIDRETFEVEQFII